MNRTYGYTDYGVINSRNKEESFTYDPLNRLTNFAAGTVAYDAQGNITSKSNADNYQYTHASKPNAVTQLSNAKTAVAARNQTVDYYGFKRPKSITENSYTATFRYNVNFDRSKMHLTKNRSRELTRYYLGGCYEIDETGTSNIKEKLYLGGNYYTAPAVYVRENGGITHITTVIPIASITR